MRAEARFRARSGVQRRCNSKAQRSKQQRSWRLPCQQLQRFGTGLAKLVKAVADFDGKSWTQQDVPVTQTMRDAILESEVGALLTYLPS